MATVRATLTASQPVSLVIQLHGWGSGRGDGWLPTVMARPDGGRRPGGRGSFRQLDGASSPGKDVPILGWTRDWAAALLLVQQLEALRGYAVQIVTTAYGTWKVVYVDEVNVVPIPGYGPPLSGVQARAKVQGSLSLERQPDA